MFRIWARTQIKDKIIFSRVFEFEGEYKAADFYDYVTVICSGSDIPVPVVLTKHVSHFTQFNNTRFRMADFVEQVGFECMVLENMPDDKKKKGQKPPEF